MMQPEYDETRCDHCGAPTPRLTPPADVELCDDCHAALTLDMRASLSKIRQAALNEATYAAYIRKMWQAN